MSRALVAAVVTLEATGGAQAVNGQRTLLPKEVLRPGCLPKLEVWDCLTSGLTAAARKQLTTQLGEDVG